MSSLLKISHSRLTGRNLVQGKSKSEDFISYIESSTFNGIWRNFSLGDLCSNLINI